MLTINRKLSSIIKFIYKKTYNAQYAAFSQSKGFGGNLSGIGMAIFLYSIVILYGFIALFLISVSFLFILLYIIIFLLYGTEKGITFTNYIFDFFGANPDKERDLVIHETLKKIKKLRREKKIILKQLNKIKKAYDNDKTIIEYESEIKQINLAIYSLKKEIVRRVKELDEINTNKNDDIPKIKAISVLVIFVLFVLYCIYLVVYAIQYLRHEIRDSEIEAQNKVFSTMYIYDDFKSGCKYTINDNPYTLNQGAIHYNFEDYKKIHEDVTNDLNIFERISNNIFVFTPEIVKNGLIINIDVDMNELKVKLKEKNLGSVKKQLKLQADYLYGRLLFENMANIGHDTSRFSKSNKQLGCRFEFLRLLEYGKNILVKFYNKDTRKLITSFNFQNGPWLLYNTYFQKNKTVTSSALIPAPVKYAESTSISTLYDTPFLLNYYPEQRSKHEIQQIIEYFND